MKKIVLVVVAALLFSVTSAYAKGGIFIVPMSMPSWVIDSMEDTEGYWFTDRYAYAVGIAKPMHNHSLQRTAAENRARANLLKGLHVTNAVMHGVEIRSVWEHPDTHETYALARMPINIVPREK